MSNAHFPILSLMILLPIAGAVAIGFCANIKLVKTIAVAAASLGLAASLWLVYSFNPDDGGLQFIEHHAWIPSLHVEYLLGVDGISVLFLPLTAILTLMSIVASWRSPTHSRLYFSLLLCLEAASLGVFSALDMVLFFCFWQLTLPPLFFLTGVWGLPALRRNAASKAILVSIFGSLPLLFAIIILAVNHAMQINGHLPLDLSFSFPVLLETQLPDHLQGIVFVLLLIGFATKAPLVPLHTWLPQVAMAGPAPVTALLIGLKLGIYGILRYAMTLTPSAAVEYDWLLGIIGAITLIYGALLSLQQSNLRRLLAFASVSHAGLVIIGIASLNMQGIQGAILQLLNFTLIMAVLMLVAGFIQHRLGSTDLHHLGGLAQAMPKLTGFYFLFMLASIGIPGGNVFPAELLLVLGALQAHPSLGITALTGAVLSTACLLAFSRRAFLGASTRANRCANQDLRPRELILLCLPLLLMLFGGLFPNCLLGINQKAAEVWLTRLLDQPGMEGDELASWTGAP
ncbi:MAG: NADH-quinone oxidoreductase subunit M [Methylovulum sp.]|uniref:complex I subunit 4 family protein n=1 Tax=Methylovulum sp. TaxID=1916980 RepID=UPI0026092ED3|nr:NADH-quinone oxidoreductase subunit M [Methylovulum sp.]MDD2725229.1 NADH-quinone oxidoreductase subunit M [Methylovulum sp.]MDD5124791.1 NADH-quinone oxidoreductase subunit M [Methylovulum sp.]